MGTMDELLAKYMLGEATNDEVKAIDDWVKASDDNLKYFTHFKLIWQTGELLKIESKLDTDASWAEFKQLTKQTNNDTATIKQLNPWTRWMKAAAIWLALFGTSAIVYNLLKPVKVTMLTLQTAGLVKTDTLADGSVITLNKYSVITYPDKFTGDTREIKLNKGEAFFDIVHNKKKPFLIHVNDAVVQVLGTSFNIKNSAAQTQVIVETGVVQVIRKKVVVRLTPKEKVDINYQSGDMKKSLSMDQLYDYYRTKQLKADNTPCGAWLRY
jgi:transmembrane sensor